MEDSMLLSVWVGVLSFGGFSGFFVVVFGFFCISEIRNAVWILHLIHDCYLNFHQVLGCFCAFKPKHLEKCIFQGKKSSSLFIIRSTFQESKTFHLPFKNEHHFSRWLEGFGVWSQGTPCCQVRKCCATEQGCSYLDQDLLLQFF